MAEDSMLWTTSGTGDGPGGGYTQQNWLDYHRYFFTPDVEATNAVLPRKGNKLACTAGSSSVNVDTGAAFVYGFFYKNTASVNVPITTPTLGTTGLRVVLRASWAVQTVRATVIRNSDGVAAVPAATQTPGTTYDVTLATGTITTGGVVTLTDARAYLQIANEVSGSMLNANVADNSTIELIANVLRVKDTGITGAKLNSNTVDNSTLELVATQLRQKDNGTTNAKLRDSAALSVIGRSANSTGDPADITTTAASGAVLRESGSTIGFGQVATAGIVDLNVTTIKIANDAIDDTKAGNRIPQFYRRQGGSATNWATTGTGTQTPTSVRMQAGSIGTSGGGTVTVTFPVAFSNVPLVWLSSGGSSVFIDASSITATNFVISAYDHNFVAVGATVYWLAIGPE